MKCILALVLICSIACYTSGQQVEKWGLITPRVLENKTVIVKSSVWSVKKEHVAFWGVSDIVRVRKFEKQNVIYVALVF